MGETVSSKFAKLHSTGQHNTYHDDDHDNNNNTANTATTKSTNHKHTLQASTKTVSSCFC